VFLIAMLFQSDLEMDTNLTKTLIYLKTSYPNLYRLVNHFQQAYPLDFSKHIDQDTRQFKAVHHLTSSAQFL
jgi:hypothetical protein